MSFEPPLGPRRSVYIDVTTDRFEIAPPRVLAALDDLDLLYRSLCAVLYNYVPLSGHPGGSISSGRIVAGLLFGGMDYDLGAPERRDADVLSYAAGHKAMGLYAMWALRTEIARLARPGLLPADAGRQLRFEDLLGFRRSPITATPLFREKNAKALDGHPTPATPFVRLATGASGVGLAASIGLALGAVDTFGSDPPRVHVLEGEGGLTPGRVAEALAAAATAGLANVTLHVDWNQASIDSEHVCRDGAQPGDYVQWSPAELFRLHDWNVVFVPDGTALSQVMAAQAHARTLDSGQPTAIVYRTTKGWRYGIEGRASHGAGHKLCSAGFHAALEPLVGPSGAHLPTCDRTAPPCELDPTGMKLEACLWEALEVVRGELARRTETVEVLAETLEASRARLEVRGRTPRSGAPQPEAVFRVARDHVTDIPAPLVLPPGTVTTLRAELGRVLGHLNAASGGAIMVATADLLSSTSTHLAAAGFPQGFFHARENPLSRALSTGGICEDAMSGILSGLSSGGGHVGVGASYGAFMAPLGHIAARLHAIGNQARQAQEPGPYRPFVLTCAHAGLKTGEDGPTHADPQALQLLEDNFPLGTMITLTPWDPQELWPTMAAALARRPAVIAPFVTRPSETVLDRARLGLAPATAAAKGVYALRRAVDPAGVVVLQGSAVTYAFLEHTLGALDARGISLDVYYVASSELFDLLPPYEQHRIFPESAAARAIGITDFTLATMQRWVTSQRGRAATLHPFRGGHYLGSGQGAHVLAEAGLDGPSQVAAILRHLEQT